MTLVVLAMLMASLVPPAAPCAGPESDRAPDPRCQEGLDGRAPASPAAREVAGRAALAIPRMTATAVLWPLVTTMDVVESNHVTDWARAVLTSDDGLVGVRPEMQYSTSFLPTGGLRLFYGRLPGSGTQLVARARTAGPAVLFGQIGLRGPSSTHAALSLTADHRTDRLFAGIGANSEGELAAAGRGAARYASDNFGAEVTWSPPVGRPFMLALHGDVQRRDYRSAGVRGGPSVAEFFGLAPEQCAALGRPAGAPCVDGALVPGFDRGLRVAHAGGAVGLNLRGRSRDASGVTVVLDTTFASGVAGDPSRHATVWGETVLAWGYRDKLLLLRGRAASVENLGSAAVPFDELIRPGGLGGMRGFPDGRFRGPSGMVGTAEYRWYISSYLDATLFADLGTVAGPRFAGLNRNDWFPSVGAGVRFYQPRESYWDAQAEQGLQVAYAPHEGVRVLFALAAF